MSAPTSTPSVGVTSSTATTIFVRNLPYSWRDGDFERAFEHIGPIKRAFVVTTRGSKKSQQLGADGAVGEAGATVKFENRGFGFIEFATHSDARRAVEEMNGKVVDTPNEETTHANANTKKKGPQKLAVELSVPKGEKPAIAKKDSTTPTPSTTEFTAATTTAAATAPQEKKDKKDLLKNVKLDAETVKQAISTQSKPKVVAKLADDSETSEDESDDDTETKPKEEEKKEVKVEKKTETKAPAAAKKTDKVKEEPKSTTTSTSTSSAPSAHTPAKPKSTPTASSSTPASTDSTSPNSRTVLLSGINPTVKSLDEHLKGLVSNLSFILFPSPESTTKYKAARLTFESDILAEAAVKLLDGKLLKGDPVRAIRLQNEVKSNRLIIRNLPWLVGEKRLHLIFRDCCKPIEQGGGGGKIAEIQLPKESDGKSKGFGFISFTTLRAAELALKKTGTILNNRPIAVDWALAKDDYQVRVRQSEEEEKKQKEKEAEAEKDKKSAAAKEKKKSAAEGEIKVKTEDADGDADMLDMESDKKKNKSILDSILGKDADEEDEDEQKPATAKKSTASKMKSEDDMSDVESDEKGGYEDEDESMDSDEEDEDDDDEEHESGSESDDESDDSGASDHEDDDLNMSGDESDDSAADSDVDLGDEAAPELDQTTTPKFTRPSDTLKGCTIFIRNLSYDTTEAKLLDKFKQFGEVKYGKVVWDKELDRSKGTAFVQFTDPEVAKKVVGMSVDTSTNPAVLYKKNRITAAVATGQGITLDGRVLNIALAVDREQANSLAEKNKLKQKEDKRNLYLANEGNIRADSEAARSMPPAELEKREKAFREKKKKLKNPNYCVSRTRLSVRNLPIDADEKLLKRVFLKAARDAIKQQPKDSPLRDGTIGQPVIQQVKLLRSTDRFDSKGEGRSKRYGFVEFDRHEHSLLALRALNNNPNAFANAEDLKSGKHSRPFVEFALEDARKLLIRNQKRAAQLKRKELKEKQQAELDAAAGIEAKKAKKPQVKSSEQPRKKPLKPVADPNLGGGRGACFNCGEGGHISRNCPKLKSSGEAAENGKSNVPQVKKTAPNTVAGGKRKADDDQTEPAAKKSKNDTTTTTPAAAPAPVKKNKNNRHADVAIPKHLNDGGKDEDHFDKLVQQHKKKFFGDGEKVKAAASRWFD